MGLKEIWEQQEKFNKDIDKDDINNIRVFCLAAMVELSEMLQETPWKPWKKNQEFNKVLAKEELIDVMHFIVNLALCLGMTYDEFDFMFMEKNKVNFRRREYGY